MHGNDLTHVGASSGVRVLKVIGPVALSKLSSSGSPTYSFKQRPTKSCPRVPAEAGHRGSFPAEGTFQRGRLHGDRRPDHTSARARSHWV